jgi:hypothetical protein
MEPTKEENKFEDTSIEYNKFKDPMRIIYTRSHLDVTNADKLKEDVLDIVCISYKDENNEEKEFILGKLNNVFKDISRPPKEKMQTLRDIVELKCTNINHRINDTKHSREYNNEEINNIFSSIGRTLESPLKIEYTQEGYEFLYGRNGYDPKEIQGVYKNKPTIIRDLKKGVQIVRDNDKIFKSKEEWDKTISVDSVSKSSFNTVLKEMVNNNTNDVHLEKTPIRMLPEELRDYKNSLTEEDVISVMQLNPKLLDDFIENQTKSLEYFKNLRENIQDKNPDSRIKSSSILNILNSTKVLLGTVFDLAVERAISKDKPKNKSGEITIISDRE